MDLTQLYQFKIIAELENLNAASDVLYTSQPALTKSIKRLESEVGCDLFDRKNKRISLNPAGKIMLDFACTVLNEQNKLLHRLGELNDGAILRIASPFIQLMRYLIPLYSQESDQKLLLTTLPEAQIESAMFNHEFTLAITGKPLQLEDVTSIQIGTRRTLISVPSSSPLFNHDEISWEDLDGQKFLEVSNDYSSEFAIAFYSRLHSMHIKAKTVTVDDYYLYLQTLPYSDCIALSSNIAKLIELPIENRRYIPLKDDPFKTQIYFCFYEANRASVAPFVDWVRKYQSPLLNT